ncbi:MAG: hypothetical protein JSS27_16245 [Planctomycetes bacterium]|nr:hypothetical protein [Planctomycetota bacterium]
MKVVQRLWSEQEGFLLSAEAVLYASIAVLGVIAGFGAVREAVVTELADVAQAIANLDQSYSISGTFGHCAVTAGGQFVDLPDFCDSSVTTTNFQQSKCVQLCVSVHIPGAANFDGSTSP